jgi:hypothetical protein
MSFGSNRGSWHAKGREIQATRCRLPSVGGDRVVA